MNFKISKTNQVCVKHGTALYLVCGHEICKNCADELMHAVKENAQAEIDGMVRANHFDGARLPTRYMQSGFIDYIVSNSGQRTAKEQCIQYAKSLLRGVKSNFVMVGSTGTGKTHLACATARNLLDKGLFVRYITSADLISKITESWESLNDNEASVIYRFTEYDLLIVDEYGLHDRNEKLLPLVHKVLTARYDEEKPTMLISNLTLSDMQKDLGDRLWSRLQQSLAIVQCNWTDARIGGAA